MNEPITVGMVVEIGAIVIGGGILIGLGIYILSLFADAWKH